MDTSDFVTVLPEPRHDEKRPPNVTRWQCYLRGVKIGTIERYSDKQTHEYFYSLCVYDFISNKPHISYVGRYCTMYEARNALKTQATPHIDTIKTQNNTATPTFLPVHDEQFYPTPANIAGKLMECIDWKAVSSILEPSAGRGDLIEWVNKRCNGVHVRGHASRYSMNINDIDCIEIDPNLRALLSGKGFRVVHDDFLTYTTRKRYDLIIMNPPFAQGAEHLLYAMELCQSGGQIACILNAETLRNPYTNNRKLLVKKLREYGATIRCVTNGFAKADRKTGVDIALVNVNIPKKNDDSAVWETLNKAPEAVLTDDKSQEVAPADPIAHLIKEYELVCETGMMMMEMYNSVAARIRCDARDTSSSPIIRLSIDGTTVSRCESTDFNRFLCATRERYWHALFDLPQLKQKMTSDMMETYDNAVANMRNYEFSRFNIQQIINQITSQINSGVEGAIVKCFDKLSAEHAYNSDILNGNIHYYNGWASNKAHRVNDKCVIPTWGCFARGYKRDKYGRYKETNEGLSPRGCFQVLGDLDKALDYLSKGEIEGTDLSDALQIAANAGVTSNIQCKYFTVTFYKKGTCHIKFNDKKLLERLNIFVGRQRNWLPPTYGKVHYDDMSSSEQAVIDEFQGRDAYETVCNAASDYLIDIHTTPLLMA